MLIALSLFSFIPILTPKPAMHANPALTRTTQAQAQTQTQAAAPLTGVVQDGAGGAVSGATVIARTPTGTEQRAVTGLDGKFTISLPAPFELTVRAGGFAEKKQSVTTTQAGSTLDVVLAPGSVTEQVTVTATRGEERLADVPASVTVLNRKDIQESPAIVADDLLRQIPQFALFRRSSSMSVHPTSQGVSLRGIGPSGVSRSLVLVDGVPYNDPFGGWVYWTGIPMVSADRVEVVDNSSSSLYGNYAMGGVINILTAKPTPKTVELKTQYGNRNTPKVDYRLSNVWGKLGVSVDGSAFDTDGFVNVVPSERLTVDQGGVDKNIDAKFHSFNVKAEYAASDRVQLFGRASYFREERVNGKATTWAPDGTRALDQTNENNDTTSTTTSFGARIQLPDQSALQATIFTNDQTFDSNFLSISNDRTTGRVALNQVVPTTGVGGMVQWTRSLGPKQVLTAGTDWRWVDGESQETVMNFTNGLTPVTNRFAGGTQNLFGAFVQDIIAATPKLQLTLSARVDHWRNYNAHFLESSAATGLPTANNKSSCEAADPTPKCLAERTDTVGSPRAAALYHLTDKVSVWGDYGLGFRAPTLNELYRQFSVGAVTTQANSDLRPEHLKGGELGVNFEPVQNLTARVTWFDNRIKDPVANVTIVAPNLQQRQNMGRTRIAGLQTDLAYQIGPAWRLTGSYLYERARVLSFPAKPALVDDCPGPAAADNPNESCFLAQVPENRAAGRLIYDNPRFATVAVGLQFVGRQFDDDENARFIPAAALSDAGYAATASDLTHPGMPGYALVDLLVSRAIGRNVEVFLSGENLLNQDYFVGTLPTLLGPPRLVTGGFRVNFQGK